MIEHSLIILYPWNGEPAGGVVRVLGMFASVGEDLKEHELWCLLWEEGNTQPYVSRVIRAGAALSV